jgi:hypothetical protein
MKSLQILFISCVLILCCKTTQAQEIKSDQTTYLSANKIELTRGQSSKIPVWRKKKPGKRWILSSAQAGKYRGAGKGCGIQFTNESSHEVDIYIDEKYVGSLGQGAKGTIGKLISYQSVNVYAVDNSNEWSYHGSCPGEQVIVLRKD